MKIIVKDNGCGILEDIRELIYNIGIISKSSGYGFGMYIVKKIIDEVKGSINFKVNNGIEWNIFIFMERS